jgi:hypothetical protein
MTLSVCFRREMREGSYKSVRWRRRREGSKDSCDDHEQSFHNILKSLLTRDEGWRGGDVR